MKPKTVPLCRASTCFTHLTSAASLALGLFVACSTDSAHAQATWVGDTSQDWNIAANWSSDPANPTGNFTINTSTAGVFPILAAASSFAPAEIIIGSAGAGRLDQTAGMLATGAGNWLRVGNGGTGTFNLSGGTFTGRVHMARVAGTTGTGTISVSGAGMLVSPGELVVSDGQNNTATALGTLDVAAGGTVNSEGDLIVAWAGNSSTLGQVNIAAGATVNVGSTIQRWVVVNQWDSARGLINVNGGTLNLNANSDLRFSAGNNGVGVSVINLNSGAISSWSGNGTGAATSGDVDLMTTNVAGNNTFNLNGGTLSVRAVYSTFNNGTAVFNFNGGTLKAVGNNVVENNFVRLEGANQRVNVRNGGAIVDSNGHDVVIGDGLQHSNIGGDNAVDGGLTKLGAGNLTLQGAGTSYTGHTTVSGGTLTINGASLGSSSGVTVSGTGAKFVLADFGTLGASTPVLITEGAIDSNGTIDSLTIADLATNNVSAGVGGLENLTTNTLAFQGDAGISLQASGSYMDQMILVDSALTTVPANGVVSVNVTNTEGVWTADPAGWDYVIIDHGGTYAGSAETDFAVGTLSPPLGAGQIAEIVDNGLEIVLRISGDPLSWTGNISANWNTTQSNWNTIASGDTTYTEGQAVLFEDGANFVDVNLAQNVAPGSITFGNLFDDYTISSAGGFGITGSASVILNGGGQVTLETDNSYTGQTNILDGTLIVSGSGSIADSSSIALGAFGELILDIGTAAEYPNPITGSGFGVTKQGVGTLTLSGANTFTGDFTLDAGQLNLNSAGALGAGPGTITFNSGTLDNTSGGTIIMGPNKPQTWNSDINFLGSNSLFMSNGEVLLTGSRSVNVAANTFAVGAVVDAGAGYHLLKAGAGNLILNGGNIGGNLDIQGGIVGINQDFTGAAPIGTGILQNAGAVGTKWTFWTGDSDVTSGLLIRDNDGMNQTQLGLVKRGTGTLTLTNASNHVTSNLSVDSGRLVLNAGTYGARTGAGAVSNHVSRVGSIAGANAVLEIDGATLNYNSSQGALGEPWRNTFEIGLNGTGAGAVKLHSGSLTTYRMLRIGAANGAYGALSQTGGTTTIGGFISIADQPNTSGVLNLAGGTITQNGPVTLGAQGIGLLNLSGTTSAYNYNNSQGFGFWIGERATGRGTINVSGSATLTLDPAGSGIIMARDAGSVGSLNLLGGTVTTNGIVGGAGMGMLNFNGGTLAANAPSATFLNGLSSAHVRIGGGTISNGGNAITIGQVLLAPTGNGVAATGLTVSGGGYIDRPLVTITGDGTGATAVADIDSNGNLTDITITNPGSGYTTPPTFALVGGGVGNTGSIGGAATLVANTSGGLTFSGAGITTLSGVNTYTGTTTIGGGTTVVVGNGGALTVKPTTNGVSSNVTGAGAVSFDGTLRVDLSAANLTNGNSWTVVDAASKAFNAVTFKVSAALGDFTALGDGVTHRLVDGNNIWTFSETTGVLGLAVTAASGFESWIGGFGLAPADQDPSDDPDNDGVKNIVEYALGRNPATSDGAASTASRTATHLVLTFSRGDLAVSSADVSILVEYGGNLTDWTEVAVPTTSGTVGGVTFSIADGSPNDTVVASIPHGGAAKFFARVEAVK